MLGKAPHTIYCGRACQQRAWYARNKEKARLSHERSLARRSPEQVAKAAEAKRAYRKANPERDAEYNRRWRERNRDYIKEYGKRSRENNPSQVNAWRKANPDRAREQGRIGTQKRRARLRDVHGSLSASELRARLETFGGACCYCGAKGKLLEADHFLPLSAGGTHTPSNIVPACGSCNRSKNAADPEQWFRAQPFFTERRWQEILKAVGKAKQHHGQLALL